jgi:hypothetical protein
MPLKQRMSVVIIGKLQWILMKILKIQFLYQAQVNLMKYGLKA